MANIYMDRNRKVKCTASFHLFPTKKWGREEWIIACRLSTSCSRSLQHVCYSHAYSPQKSWVWARLNKTCFITFMQESNRWLLYLFPNTKILYTRKRKRKREKTKCLQDDSPSTKYKKELSWVITPKNLLLFPISPHPSLLLPFLGSPL